MEKRKKHGLNRRLALGAGLSAVAGLGYLAARPVQHTPRLANLDPNTFYRGNAAEPETLDPSLADAIWETDIIGDLIVGLTTENEKAEPIPGMATSWTTSPDGLIWTFKLREAVWSDGVPVTADDFVFAWRRILDPDIASSYSYFIWVVKN